MSEPVVLAEKLLGLLDEASLTSTYKPAVLLALVDRCQARLGDTASDPSVIPVRELAGRVADLYWPQTVAYPDTGRVLAQNSGGQAAIVAALSAYRADCGVPHALTLAGLQTGRRWEALLDHVETVLAEWPLPRLQRPYPPFLYHHGWPSAVDKGWSKRRYAASDRAIHLLPGVASGLVALAPLLRPFIVRWWTDKAAALNRDAVRDAGALVDFEQFLFGRERVALTRLAGDLRDLQNDACFYCGRRLARVEVDHFLPWRFSGDDGVDNLVAACPGCNNAKRAVLPAAEHVGAWVERARRWPGDLASIAETKRWPRDEARTRQIGRSLYLFSPDERPTWRIAAEVVPLGAQRTELAALLT